MKKNVRSRAGMVRAAFYAAIALALLTSCAKKTAGGGKADYELATIVRGSIEKSVSSSGKLEPVSSVSVLAQMSGSVERVYADYNDHVKKGQVLVELNTEMLRLDQDKQRAAVAKAKATYDLQSLNYANQLKLADKGLISDYEVRQAKTSLAVAEADYLSAKAGLKVIETEINQYAFIKSPITGIVLARNVDVGQNVVEGSSSNSSSLFTIAEDLTQMEIEATVEEVDIASIKPGQAVRFSVEALPGKSFAGKVGTIRLVPSTSENVVSYTVIVAIDNAGGALLPGMTADVSFIVSRSDDVLVVPNAALRFEPTSLTESEIAAKIFDAELALLSPDARAKAIDARAKKGSASATKRNGGLASIMMPRGPGGSRGTRQNGNGASSTGGDGAQLKNLWYLDAEGALAVIKVKALVSDGMNTEIEPAGETANGLEGMKAIVKERVN